MPCARHAGYFPKSLAAIFPHSKHGLASKQPVVPQLKNVMRIEEKDCAAIKDLLAVVREQVCAKLNPSPAHRKACSFQPTSCVELWQVAGPDSIGDLYSAEKLAVACNDLGPSRSPPRRS